MTAPIAVFDCMVYLQAAARPEGPARACVALAEANRIELSISPAILAELNDVLGRPKMLQKFKSLTPESIAVFLKDISHLAVRTESVSAAFALPRDPKDEPYLNLALSVGAAFLVTWDRDLLDLMDDASAQGKDFHERFPELKILTPVAFLSAIRDLDAQKPTSGELPIL